MQRTDILFPYWIMNSQWKTVKYFFETFARSTVCCTDYMKQQTYEFTDKFNGSVVEEAIKLDEKWATNMENKNLLILESNDSKSQIGYYQFF